MKWIDYRKRLGIGFSDEAKKKLFITRVNVWISNCHNIPYSDKDEYKFSYEIGHVFLYQSGKYSDFGTTSNYYDFQEDKSNLRRVEHYLLSHSDSIEDLLSCLVVLYNKYDGLKVYKYQIYDDIIKILEDCDIAYEIINDEDGTFIFPKGAPELDSALINEPLQWLNEYPNSQRAFIKALKGYSNENMENASEVADLFRKALETFFQEFFNNNKSLEHMKSDYGSYMNNMKVPPELYNSFEKLLGLYAKFMNEYAKHHDRVCHSWLEFIMYQTGNLIRFMITLKKSEGN